MNRLNVVKFKLTTTSGLFVRVPDMYNEFVIKQYSFAGTWVMESESPKLNHWKINIPQNSYKIIGVVHTIDEKLLIENNINLDEYFSAVQENDIIVDSTQYTDKWLLLIEEPVKK